MNALHYSELFWLLPCNPLQPELHGWRRPLWLGSDNWPGDDSGTYWRTTLVIRIPGRQYLIIAIPIRRRHKLDPTTWADTPRYIHKRDQHAAEAISDLAQFKRDLHQNPIYSEGDPEKRIAFAMLALAYLSEQDALLAARIGAAAIVLSESPKEQR